MAYKIGFHTGPGGNATGIGDYFRRLDAAGIPAILKAVDSYGPAFELVELAKASGVEHLVIFRLSTKGTGGGEIEFDVPDYSLTPTIGRRSTL